MFYIKEKHVFGMPNVKSKSIENYKAAILLSNGNNKMYSTSIHCAYYACFQFMKHILDKKCYISYNEQDTRAKNGDLGTHNYIINEILADLERKKEEDAYDIFDENISELKRLRIIADYKPVIIIDKQAHSAVKHVDETLKALKGVYKGL